MRALLFVSVLLGAAAGAACSDDLTPGPRSACDTPAGGLQGCPPPDTTPLTIEQACFRLVECGLIPVERPEDYGDYAGCINQLRGNDFPEARLTFVLACVGAATCDDLAQDHCTDFGRDQQ